MPSFGPSTDDDIHPSNTLISWVSWMVDFRSDAQNVRAFISSYWPTTTEGGNDEDDTGLLTLYFGKSK